MNIISKPFANVTLSPNPAADHINISASFDKPAASVTYTIIDGLARFVTKEVHNNIEAETFDLSTAKLAPGSYYLVINANGQVMARPFVIVK